MDDNSLNLNEAELTRCFSDPVTAARFPPILTLEEAAELVRVPIGTLRDWRSRGLLSCCSRRVGKEVRFFRDRLIKKIFNVGLGN
jgi:hypothetical protein